MNAATVLTPSLRTPKPRTEAERRARAELREEHRWELYMVSSFAAAALFFGLGIATGEEWPIGVAVVVGPILMIFAFIYLCVSCDSNGAGWKQA